MMDVFIADFCTREMVDCCREDPPYDTIQDWAEPRLSVLSLTLIEAYEQIREVVEEEIKWEISDEEPLKVELRGFWTPLEEDPKQPGRWTSWFTLTGFAKPGEAMPELDLKLVPTPDEPNWDGAVIVIRKVKVGRPDAEDEK